MIPLTKNGMNAMSCVSALQKCIRRAQEREAMEFACELMHTSKAFCSMVCNRLAIICQEDLDCVGNPWLVPTVHTFLEHARLTYKFEAPGNARMAIGNAIRIMCRVGKSREGNHFQAAIGLKSERGVAPEIPDYANDMHTHKGRRMGRGLDHFRAVGAVLVPQPPKDKYEDEAYEEWQLEAKRKADAKAADDDQSDFFPGPDDPAKPPRRR
jgi:replication-associated recombination protein RarA